MSDTKRRDKKEDSCRMANRRILQGDIVIDIRML